MRRLFLDTGYLIALEASDDQHHQQAAAYWQSLSRSLPGLVTTSYVFDEVVTFFNSRVDMLKPLKSESFYWKAPR